MLLITIWFQYHMQIVQSRFYKFCKILVIEFENHDKNISGSTVFLMTHRKNS